MLDTPNVNLEYKLDDRYSASPRVYITGTQALVRIVLEQAALDRARGLNIKGFVSGYRGSPLGAVDQQLWAARKKLDEAGVVFKPAINEDMAATAVLGTQRVEADPDKTVTGVFAMWYGKGPGVDRSGDALKHGNAYGSSPNGGVLVVAGDDHGCVSSSMSHQSDLAMVSWRMPVIHPTSIAEYVRFGLWGIAASRFSGAWVGFKAISETVEGAASVPVEPLPEFVMPTDFTPPASGLHIRWPDFPGPQIEQRLPHKLDAIRAFARANPLDQHLVAPKKTKLLIVTVGKAHADTLEALRVGGISLGALEKAGVGLLKIGLVYPLETDMLMRALGAAEEVLVIEEKAPVVEDQIKLHLFTAAAKKAPQVLGKRDETGAALILEDLELRPSRLALALQKRLANYGLKMSIPQAWLEEAPMPQAGTPVRTPYFCSGCPHNTSTRLPEGSKALAGIGCHFMANWMDRDTSGLIQMGAEGVDWMGQAPFTNTKHVFQNLGDGTFFHSGHLAVRQSVAAGTNITYKILYNDAVAMTGGQPVDGSLSVPQIAQLMLAENARRVVVVTDEPEKYEDAGVGFPKGVSVHHRDELDAVQRELRDIEGVTVLIYDQTCAAEKRRRRKKKQFPDPPKRIFINDLVCEGCGDCQKKSNCLSVVPLETEFGRKRMIEQSSCNKDYSCIKGFCPSFVTVEGGELKKGQGIGLSFKDVQERAAKLQQPQRVSMAEKPYEMLVAGVGGTGIVTVGAVTVMAAHLEGKSASVLDFMGFAQKGGIVLSYVRLADRQDMLHQVRIDRGGADAIIAADLVVTSSKDALGVIDKTRTKIVANTRELPTGAMLRDNKSKIDTRALGENLRRRVAEGSFSAIDAQGLAESLIGDAVQANILMLGYAWQAGLVPVSFEALAQAIRLNGVAIEANLAAIAWGRLVYAEPDFIAELLEQLKPVVEKPATTLEEIIARRFEFLTGYQNAAYAARYRQRIEAVQALEQKALGEGSQRLTEAAARYLFKLMAYKDEYEVARLYTHGSFRKKLASTFTGDFKLTFHLAPPALSKIHEGETEPRKITFGTWMMTAFSVLAKFKFLRGTALDPFGKTEERKMERQMIAGYEQMLDEVLPQLNAGNQETVLALLSLPDDIRGYGPVKERSIHATMLRHDALMAQLNAPVVEGIKQAS